VLIDDERMEAMFENVVVGVKDREAGLDAIELARRLLAPDGNLLLVDVRDPRRLPAPRLDEIEPQLAVQELGPLRSEAGVDADLLSLHARTVAAGLHSVARERGDLLVIGASRRDYYERVYIGDDMRAVLAPSWRPSASSLSLCAWSNRSTWTARSGSSSPPRRRGWPSCLKS
jgi:nucleotide-binding universal stress UspA family protein